MRHSDAPGSGGYGDPPGYRLDDCATQRNLSDEGRAHARRTGEAFRKQRRDVRSRADQPLVPLQGDGAAGDGEGGGGLHAAQQPGRPQRAHGTSQVKALKAYLAGLDGKTRVLFVTHGIVINALTGVSPASGEMVIVKPGPGGEPKVVGRLKVD